MKRFVALCLLFLSGCSQTQVTEQKPAPPGFLRAGDSPKGFPVGTTIYNGSGGLIGVVVQLDANHAFPDGTAGLGVYLKRPESETPVWYSGVAVQNGLFVKE